MRHICNWPINLLCHGGQPRQLSYDRCTSNLMDYPNPKLNRYVDFSLTMEIDRVVNTFLRSTNRQVLDGVGVRVAFIIDYVFYLAVTQARIRWLW